MARLSLAKANRIISLALTEAKQKALKPLAVVVLDAGGAVRAAQVQDGVPLGRFDVAAGKARGALFVGSASRTLHGMAVDRPHFVGAVASVLHGGLIPVPGGLVIRTTRGEVVGAIGISGDTSDNDETAAAAGIIGAGFVPGEVN